jgi:putative endonuclease
MTPTLVGAACTVTYTHGAAVVCRDAKSNEKQHDKKIATTCRINSPPSYFCQYHKAKTNIMRNFNFWVYITTNPTQTSFYIGMTNNLVRRLVEHYQNRGKPETFAGKFYCYNLVWSEWHQYIYNAIGREKELKTYTRQKKLELIQQFNPQMRFLNAEFCGVWPPNQELLEALSKLREEPKA